MKSSGWNHSSIISVIGIAVLHCFGRAAHLGENIPSPPCRAQHLSKDGTAAGSTIPATPKWPQKTHLLHNVALDMSCFLHFIIIICIYIYILWLWHDLPMSNLLCAWHSGLVHKVHPQLPWFFDIFRWISHHGSNKINEFLQFGSNLELLGTSWTLALDAFWPRATPSPSHKAISASWASTCATEARIWHKRGGNGEKRHDDIMMTWLEKWRNALSIFVHMCHCKSIKSSQIIAIRSNFMSCLSFITIITYRVGCIVNFGNIVDSTKIIRSDQIWSKLILNIVCVCVCLRGDMRWHTATCHSQVPLPSPQANLHHLAPWCAVKRERPRHPCRRKPSPSLTSVASQTWTESNKWRHNSQISQFLRLKHFCMESDIQIPTRIN